MSASFFGSLFLLSSLAFLQANYLTGKHFRAGFVENSQAAYIEVNADNQTVVRGFLITLLEWMSLRANFTYTLIHLNYTERFPSLPRQFDERKIDFGVGNFVLSDTRNMIAKFLFPLYFTTYAVIIPYPKREANIYSVVLPYTLTVWFCFFASMIVISVLLRCFARTKRYIHQYKENDSFLTYRGAILYVVGVSTNQGAACFSKARTVRILAGIWCLAALVMVNAYSGSLITYMTAARVKPVVRSVLELANKSEPQILTGDISYFRVLVEVNPVYQALADNLMKNHADYCGDDFSEEFQHCIQQVKDGRSIYVSDYGFSKTTISQDFVHSKTCTLTLADEIFPAGYGGWVVPLNTPQQLRSAIDYLYMEAASYGLLTKWSKLSESKSDFCASYEAVDRTVRRLSLTDFVGAFIILGVGTGISLTVFMVEVLSRKVAILRLLVNIGGGRQLPQQRTGSNQLFFNNPVRKLNIRKIAVSRWQ